MTARCGTSQTVRYTRLMSSGTSGIACTEPSLASSRRRRSSDHRPRDIRSSIRWRLTTTNSPAIVERLKTLPWIGSNDSQLPRICDVVAVGISAVSRLFRRPLFATRALSAAQSYACARLRGLPSDPTRSPSSPKEYSLTSSPHRSNCSLPSDAGDPSKREYGPSRSASSQLASTQPW